MSSSSNASHLYPGANTQSEPRQLVSSLSSSTLHHLAVPSSSPPSKLYSPRAQHPPSGVVAAATTAKLERAASEYLQHHSHQHQSQQQQQQHHQPTSSHQAVRGAAAPPASPASPGQATMQGTPRITNWVADSGSRGAYARGATPAPPMVGGHNIGYPAQQRSNNASGYRAPPPAPAPQQYSASRPNPHSQQQHQQQRPYAPSPPMQQRPLPSQQPSMSSAASSSLAMRMPPMQSVHPRTSSANAAPPSHYSVQQPQYQQQQQQQQQQHDARPLHQSFSDMSLAQPQNTLRPSHTPLPNGGPGSRRSSATSFHGVASADASTGPPAPARRNSDPLVPASTSSQLCAALPSQSDLASQRDAAAYAQNPAAAKVSWAKAVLKFVERSQASSAGESGKITDPTLVKWTDEGIRTILSSADMVPPVPEALYLRGELSNSGKFPSYRAKDLALAFRDYEAAANLGLYAAWAKIALAYESFGEQNGSQADFARARKAYEEGLRLQEVTCTYRMGMAHLLGQLSIPRDSARAIPLLRQAASLSTVDDPLPAYIFGMLLSGELDLGTNVISMLSQSLLSDPRTRQAEEPRPWIERSAFLGYAPAQFKMGHNYEYATMGCGYDPLLSVQYYSLASQQGDIEADMALSKWFLCGSESFDLQEGLAFTFAEKAAKRGLPSAEFALGYYYEIGIGGRKDIEQSKRWYAKAAAHGNADANARLAVINVNSSNTISRDEHQSQINDKIVRRRTQARVDADRRKQTAPPPPMPAMPHLPAIPSHYSQAQNAPIGAARPPPPRGSSAAGRNAADGFQDPAPPGPPVRLDSDMSLRRRETMRQVEQAADYGRRTNPSSAEGSGRINGRYGSPAPTERQQQQQAGGAQRREPSLAAPVSHMQRYSLTDSGPMNPNGGSGGGGGGGSTYAPPSKGSAGVPIVSPSGGKSAQTFEDMGLVTGRVKAEQECIIS